MQLAKNMSVTFAVYLRVAWVIVTPYGSFIVFYRSFWKLRSLAAFYSLSLSARNCFDVFRNLFVTSYSTGHSNSSNFSGFPSALTRKIDFKGEQVLVLSSLHV